MNSIYEKNNSLATKKRGSFAIKLAVEKYFKTELKCEILPYLSYGVSFLLLMNFINEAQAIRYLIKDDHICAVDATKNTAEKIQKIIKELDLYEKKYDIKLGGKRERGIDARLQCLYNKDSRQALIIMHDAGVLVEVMSQMSYYDCACMLDDMREVQFQHYETYNASSDIFLRFLRKILLLISSISSIIFKSNNPSEKSVADPSLKREVSESSDEFKEPPLWGRYTPRFNSSIGGWDPRYSSEVRRFTF